jgi:hypothetical protein
MRVVALYRRVGIKSPLLFMMGNEIEGGVLMLTREEKKLMAIRKCS